MGRPVVLSNGQMFVGLDENGLVHDFYYPYVGLENLTTARSSQHKIGVWVDGQFKWTDDGSWEIQVEYEPDAMISKRTSNRRGTDLGPKPVDDRLANRLKLRRAHHFLIKRFPRVNYQ